MGTYQHRLSLTAGHESADLSILPKHLDMAASRLWKVGDPSVAPNGRTIGGTRRRSACSIDFGCGADVSLPECLANAVTKLRPHKMFLKELTKTGVKLRFFIGWFSDDLNSGDRFDWELLRDIADLEIALDFDFYGPDETGPVADAQ